MAHMGIMTMAGPVLGGIASTKAARAAASFGCCCSVPAHAPSISRPGIDARHRREPGQIRRADEIHPFAVANGCTPRSCAQYVKRRTARASRCCDLPARRHTRKRRAGGEAAAAARSWARSQSTGHAERAYRSAYQQPLPSTYFNGLGGRNHAPTVVPPA